MHKRTQTQLDAVDAMDCWLPCQPLFNPDGYCKGDCFKKCPDVCRVLVADVSPFSLPVPPPPPVQQFPPPIIHEQQDEISKKHLISTSMTIASCFLGATLILGILGMMLRAYCKRQRNPSTRSTPIIFGAEEDFANEEQGPEIDHPIWYINTVGLQQSVIDSIVVFKYNKGEGLVDGAECSVCLNDFQEDENLRLLPKCSHAFHLPCIDTWLRSHKNCPLCRAPIVSANAEAEFVPSVPTTSDLNSREEPQMGNFDGSSSISDSNQEGEDGTSEVRIGVGNSGVSLTSDDETNNGNRSSKMNGDRSSLRDHVRVRSDLVGIREDVEAEMQPIRRSVSLDSSSASVIYNAVSHVIPDKDQVKVDPKQLKHSRGKRVIKRGSTESLSFRKLMKSSSIGQSLQRGPVLMKRSFSSSEKPLSSLSCGESRRHDSMLPL